MTEKQAAVGVIQREDERLLCVWNKRYGGWSFPGGLVEDKDASIYDGLRREIQEETSIEVKHAELVYRGPVKHAISTPLTKDNIHTGMKVHTIDGTQLMTVGGKYLNQWECTWTNSLGLLRTGMFLPSQLTAVPQGRGSMIYVWKITDYTGVPVESEIGCPVTWLTAEEFLKWTPFNALYAPLFAEHLLG